MRFFTSNAFAAGKDAVPPGRGFAAELLVTAVLLLSGMGCPQPGSGLPTTTLSGEGGMVGRPDTTDAGLQDAAATPADAGSTQSPRDGGPEADASTPTLSASDFSSFVSGDYTYWLYRPSNIPPDRPAPLVMMLHGCQQTALEFKADTALLELAEQEKFWVVYPEQNTSAHPLRCWRWFDAEHQERERGEPGALRAIVADIQESHTIDTEQIYVAGLSAGAAMTVILVTVYGDVFQKGFALAGLPYQAARNEFEVAWAMGAGVPDPVAKGRSAYAAMVPDTPMASLFVMHGQADLVVAFINGVHLIQQWTTCADLHWDGIENDDVSAGAAQNLAPAQDNTRAAVLQKHTLPSGDIVAASLWVEGLGHKWPGSPSGNAYADAVGPSATQWMWDFFRDNLP